MKYSWSLVLAAAVLTASTLFAAAGPRPPVAQQQPASAAAADPAAPLFSRMCSECHDVGPITAIRRTSPEWQDVITKMIDRGAQGTEPEFETVFGYLRRHYGKVQINAAPAADIEAVLTLSKKDADAIVAYRKANGPFKDFEALMKVPEIDVKKLEERKDAVAF